MWTVMYSFGTADIDIIKKIIILSNNGNYIKCIHNYQCWVVT